MTRFLGLVFVLLGCAFINSALALSTLTYLPEKLDSRRASLVVVLHGCLQSAESMAAGTGWNQIADRENLVILYPQNPKANHPLGCWSWYKPENQKPDSGELFELHSLIQKFRKSLQLESRPVYLAGLSSGAATAAGLMACFPRSFKSTALHSGPSYGLAQTLQDADRVLKEGPAASTAKPDSLPCQTRQYEGALLVLQGSGDSVVHPSHTERLISDYLPSAKSLALADRQENGLSFSITDHYVNGTRRGRTILIKDLPHAWSGFNLNLRFPELQSGSATQLPFFADQGPSATNWMWEFFQTSKP